ncbi:MAG: hypothetical protein M3065_03315 [Actinomycetota bacterium]|nr:hypothetical protein [Actinomycetota bacterium]
MRDLRCTVRAWRLLDEQPPVNVTTPSERPIKDRGRLQSLAPILVFDTAGPLIVYTLLRNNGHSTVTSLILSGVFPAFGVLLAVIRHRRLDVIGALVLIGIVVGVGLGLATKDARLVLLEGSVPTTLFALACLASLLTARPLMFRFAHEFIGRATPAGRDFADRWRYPLFRRTFRVITIVWGVTYLAEAAARIVIVETQSTGTALTISKLLPYVVLAPLLAWMTIYGRRNRRKGEQLRAAHEAQTPD